MKKTLILFAITFISVINTFAQNIAVESAIQDARLVPARDVDVIDGRKPCAIVNKSLNRLITVKIEQSTLQNNVLTKKIIAIQKLAPNEQRFVGYAGCDEDNKCVGYKIALAYYDSPAPAVKTYGKSITAR